MQYFPDYDIILFKDVLKMIIKYNTEKLWRIITDITTLTGISIAILDTDYNTIIRGPQSKEYCSLLQTIEIEKKYCRQCDMRILNKCRSSKILESHICRAGLYDSAMPIKKDDNIVGYIIMGQVRSMDSPALPKYLPDTDAQTLKTLKELYEQTPVISKNQLEALYDLLPHILFDSAIEFVYDPVAIDILKFIDANLQADLSIKQLCKRFYISKNRLFAIFRENLGCTVVGYINEQRIKRAKDLLKHSNDSVFNIAEKVGIYNYTYFCKLFKKLSGVTPTEYRKKP